MFERQEILIGDKFEEIRNKKILLVGLGGVGGSAFEMLVRLGFNEIYVVDYDKFEESNLNRQILSNRNNIRKYKVDEAQKRALNINEYCTIHIYNEKLDNNFLNNFDEKIDYIIDACDDVTAKIELIKYAVNNNIKIITCCGTGNKLDSSKLKISTIWKTNNDPLAKKIRQLLRKENINYKLPVVYSEEKPSIKESIIYSVCLVPNAAGILLVNYVLNDILNS